MPPLIGVVGGVSVVTVALLWVYMRLVRYGYSSEVEGFPGVGQVTQLYRTFLVVVLIATFGGPVGNTIIAAVGWFL